MSKVKPKVPAGHLVLLTKPNAKGECTVYVRYFLGKYIKRSTEIYVPADGWDAQRECVKPSVKCAILSKLTPCNYHLDPLFSRY